MIQRTLLRHSRALSSSLRTSPSSSLARPQFLRSPNASFARSSRQQLTASRWYSSEGSESKKEDAAAAEADKKNGEAADTVKKELESKDKEIIDLKVGRHSFPLLPIHLNHIKNHELTYHD
jgi:molecular chaperone GrpE